MDGIGADIAVSSGGSAAIEVAKGKTDVRFRAVVAFYPEYLAFGPSYRTLLIFVAGKDDWTLPDGCLRAKNAHWVAGDRI